MDPKNESRQEDLSILPGGSVQAYIAAFAVLAGLLLVFGGLISTRANADYICTRVIDYGGLSCTDGAWGGWSTVTTTTDPATGDVTTVEARVYTGTRRTQSTVQYVSNSCDAGYTRSRNRSGLSSGGTIVTESQACQIEERRTRVVDGDTGQETINGTVVTSTTDINNGPNSTTQQTTQVNSLAEINAFRRANRDLGIFVQPSLVSAGQPTTVTWFSVEMSACIVTADKNSDRWGAAALSGEDLSSLAGVEGSSPITEATTYTLSCVDFEGTQMPTEEATVYIVPQWEEI